MLTTRRPSRLRTTSM
ncbi:hypothetical protein LINPERHAP1_LOCUS35130 [Linum perenne]